MARFGIQVRGRTAPLGGISVQSVGSPTAVVSPTSVIGPSVRTGTSNPLLTIRTINPSVVSPAILAGVNMPPLFRFIPPLIQIPKKQYEQDTLRVSQFRVANASFEPVEKNGISVFRPEILSLMDFKPVDGKRSLGANDSVESAEQLVKAQYQATELRAVTLQKLMTDIRARTDLRGPLDAIKRQYVSGLSSTKNALKYFGDLIDKIEDVQDSLDPKKIPAASYDTAKFLPLVDFFERKMQYSKSKYSNFSDTKIINQLISDFRNILEGYSLSLLNLTDTDRTTDFSPTTIDKTYTQTSGFTFGIASIRSTTEAQNAFKPAFFNSFLNSLPSNPDDRIKLLSHVLSKELRVSKQLGKPEVARNLLARYSQSDTGNPFDNITGTVGDTIFQDPTGPNSLATLTSMAVDGNVTVLPFESIYVDAEDEQRVYVPGSTYFVDSILDVSATGFNTRPYVAFTNRFNDVTSNAKTTIESLLELNQTSALNPSSVYDSFLSSVAEAIGGMGSTTGINRGQAISASVFKLANTDTVLKNQLFEYLLLLGMASVTSADQKQVFERLAKEIGNIHKFTYVRASQTDNPSLNGGLPALRPFLEGLAEDIESKVFSLTTTVRFVRLTPDFIRSIPSPRPLDLSGIDLSTPLRNISGGSVGVNLLSGARFLGSSRLDTFHMSFRRGEIRETLLNNASAVLSAHSNFCKEFIDLAVKFDQVASAGANPAYLIGDLTGRTRFNFLSTSTQLLLIFEILSSFAARYNFSEFNKGTSLVDSSITIDTSLTAGLLKTIRDIVATKPTFNISNIITRPLIGTSETQLGNTRLTGNAFSLFNADRSRETLRLPYASSLQSSQNSSHMPINISPSLVQSQETLQIPNLQSLVNTPAFGFGNLLSDFSMPLMLAAETVQIIGMRKTLVSNRSKLDDEDFTVQNALHIFSVLNRRLNSTKNLVVNAFTLSSMTNIMSATGTTLSDIQVVRNPSQVRVSSWLLDRYDERTADTGTTEETQDNNQGFIATDRISPSQMNALFTMLNEPKYRYNSLADFRVKLLTVGIPAGFSKVLSDRVSRAAINETNFKDKQFDVIAIDVYKRDARYDDIVFKPQRFLFDLSLFPMKNFLPRAATSYSQIIREAQLRDYQSLKDKRTVGLANIKQDLKYDFLSDVQKQQMVKNHVESQLLDLYIRLMTGLRIDEETFTETTYSKTNLQDQNVLNLVIRYLKEVKGKDIPNINMAKLLNSETLDQETKDTLRLLSYGNLAFQSSYVRRRILDPKLFDRVFHLPFSIDDFPIDVEATRATESGRRTYTKNSVQEQIIRTNGEEYLKPRNRNDLVFEDFFVVVESNLRGGT